MTEVKYLILGAGPAGLAFANGLKQNGEDSFLVLEQEMVAGGLCKSEMVDGSPLDIGGGHFLDVKRERVNSFLFEFMSEEEWNRFTRDSRILFADGTYISHPFEANIWQMAQKKQVEYLKSIAVAGCNLELPMPSKFIEWIIWKLGDKIAEEYMIPYNQKLFGEDLNQLGSYWLDKLPNVSFEDTCLGCFNQKAYGKQPAHAEFYYPKRYGYGELWRRMADKIGEHIEYRKKVKEMLVEKKQITCDDGSRYRANYIITTIPWKSYQKIYGENNDVLAAVDSLKHVGVEITYIPDDLDTSAHWIYIPQKDVPYHRILNRHNFCCGSRGYWTETNIERAGNGGKAFFSHINEYAYPLNTVDKPEIMKKLLGYMAENNIYGLGRWGEHMHYNSDVTVEKALDLVHLLAGK